MEPDFEKELTGRNLFAAGENKSNDWRQGLIEQAYPISTKYLLPKGEDRPAAGRPRLDSIEVGPIGTERLPRSSDDAKPAESSSRIGDDSARPRSNETVPDVLPGGLPTIELSTVMARLSEGAERSGRLAEIIALISAKGRKEEFPQERRFKDWNETHTKEFDKLKAVDQFNNEGWTLALQDKLYPLICAHLVGGKATGEYGDGGWEDLQTAARMAGMSGRMGEFVGGLNERLLKPPYDVGIQVKIDHTPTSSASGRTIPFTTLIIEGADKGSMKIGFFDNDAFQPSHSPEFLKLDPISQYNRGGWTGDLKDKLAQLAVSSIGTAGASGAFGPGYTQWNDVRTAFALAQSANMSNDLMKAINERLRQTSTGTPVEVRASEELTPLLKTTIIEVVGGKKSPYSLIEFSERRN